MVLPEENPCAGSLQLAQYPWNEGDQGVDVTLKVVPVYEQAVPCEGPTESRSQLHVNC